ncbi:hypothetical protein [Mycolicibacterium tusciae]|uniref:hypothetical protein n=1 Tax=Mycolicibacterium tusciae TaxID=75922 RepID=UPI00024A1E8C|nr:hypothetical protein [Mycolicibacterium tusciae]
MATGRSSPGVAGVLGLVGVGALLVLCCAGPVLIAGGALGVLGGALGNPWLIGAAAVVVLAAVGYTLHRRGRGETAGCCPPGHPDTSTDRADERTTP